MTPITFAGETQHRTIAIATDHYTAGADSISQWVGLGRRKYALLISKAPGWPELKSRGGRRVDTFSVHSLA